MNHASLFSGIGGFDLAAEWAGWNNAFWCEWEDFPQKVLRYHFPNSIGYGDITKTDFTIWRGRIDVLTGGFPCQPYSQAGKRLGKDDERHLWPEMLRAIREIRPRWVVGENVLGLTNWNGGLVFEEVQADLEAEAYQVQPFILPAAGVGAPHQRYRVWFVAYSDKCDDGRKAGEYAKTGDGKGLSERDEVRKSFEPSEIFWLTPDTTRTRGGQIIGESKGKSNELNKIGIPTNWENFPTQSPVCGGNDGLPGRLDGITFPKWRNESIKAYGNAIVPQVAYQIFKAINEYEKL